MWYWRVLQVYWRGLLVKWRLLAATFEGWRSQKMNDNLSTVTLRREKMAESAGTYTARAYAARSATSGLAGSSIPRRNPGPQDVQIDILYCGVCHSDLHQTRNEWEGVAPTVYPCVPGHEIVGRVVKTGKAVRKFKDGDLAAVGCMVGSCGVCENCSEGLEQYCRQFPILTYNGQDKVLGGVTYGMAWRASWWRRGLR